jgi:hypothetical protein
MQLTLENVSAVAELTEHRFRLMPTSTTATTKATTTDYMDGDVLAWSDSKTF